MASRTEPAAPRAAMMDVIELLAAGLSVPDIGVKLHLSTEGARTRLKVIYTYVFPTAHAHCCGHSSSELVSLCFQRGWLDLDGQSTIGHGTGNLAHPKASQRAPRQPKTRPVWKGMSREDIHTRWPITDATARQLAVAMDGAVMDRAADRITRVQRGQANKRQDDF